MSIDDLERQLRSSLDRQATGQSGHGADLADVFVRARRIRRRRTALVTSAIAVAVVAVTVPSGVLLASRDSSAPPPPVATVSTTPTPVTTPTTPAPTASGGSSGAASGTASGPASGTASGAGLGGFAMGTPTTLTYLDPTGAMHNGQPLPGGDYNASGGQVSAFTPYHGGWLVAYDDSTLTQFSADGHSTTDHPGAPATIIASDDGTQTAWQIGRDVYAGLPSGMSDAEQHWTVGPSAGLLGFLGGGVAVSTGSGVRILTGPSTSTTVNTSVVPTVVSQTTDLIGGDVGTVAKDDQEGAMADGTTGAIRWHGPWTPLSFSPDGKYVAAIPVVDNGDPSAVAILDAQTGKVVARTPRLAKRLYLTGQVAWDGDRVVFSAEANPDIHRMALFALSRTGQVEQVSPTTTLKSNGAFGYVFMTR